MKNARNITLVCVILLAGSMVTAVLDWRQEQRATASTVRRSAEGLVSLVSLYPIANADAGMRRLLAKSLVEQSGTSLAYLLVDHADGRPLFTLGNPALRTFTGTQPATSMGRQSGERRFAAADGRGDILEFGRTLIDADESGTVLLGMRLVPPPVFSAGRLSSVATVLFLMLAALIVGYYAILLATRRWAQGTSAPAFGAAAATDDGILAAMTRMTLEFTAAREELRQTTEQNADLSSRLGVLTFESEQAYRLLDALAFGILVLDTQGCIRRANRRMLELLGGERSEFQGRSFAEAVEHEALLDLVNRQQDGAGDDASVEAQFTETAPERFFELCCRPLTDTTGDSIGTLITTQDVTGLKRARKAQEDFLAEASHELLTPLTSIKSYAELLSSGDVDNEELRREFYNTVNTETDRVSDLVRNLLSVSKLDAGHLDIERALVKTDWLVDQCLPAVEATARNKGITIEKRLPDVFPTVLGDKQLLKVVLVNILGNAIKYTPDNGTVRLSLFQQNHSVFVEIGDTGCGIPAEELPHVFEKFYRGRSADVRNQVGSGLGLATSLQVAKLHGGTIDIQSEPGKGSCFTVRLPVEDFTLEKQ